MWPTEDANISIDEVSASIYLPNSKWWWSVCPNFIPQGPHSSRETHLFIHKLFGYHSARNKLPILKIGLTDAKIRFNKVCVHPSHFWMYKNRRVSCDEWGPCGTKNSSGLHSLWSWGGRRFVNKSFWWTLHHMMRADLFEWETLVDTHYVMRWTYWNEKFWLTLHHIEMSKLQRGTHVEESISWM